LDARFLMLFDAFLWFLMLFDGGPVALDVVGSRM
jgi:hypothetical protein